jgi:hypothetical protein
MLFNLPMTDHQIFREIKKFFDGEYPDESHDMQRVLEGNAQKMGFTLEKIDWDKFNSEQAYQAYMQGPEAFEAYLDTCHKDIPTNTGRKRKR